MKSETSISLKFYIRPLRCWTSIFSTTFNRTENEMTTPSRGKMRNMSFVPSLSKPFLQSCFFPLSELSMKILTSFRFLLILCGQRSLIMYVLWQLTYRLRNNCFRIGDLWVFRFVQYPKGVWARARLSQNSTVVWVPEQYFFFFNVGEC